ncbi:hypothetical protein TCON_1619 [Astathelohania contejeani]|uniref:Uncharacterized protein n=1 Tax=Astathelohania contejeani TaxID=164912 RepID=A0ABQ7HYA6_9MICR|nr:hypothetical protein TCON_1619 [Thelohania contejeani]
MTSISPSLTSPLMKPFLQSEVINILSRIQDISRNTNDSQRNAFRKIISKEIDRVGNQCILQHAIFPNIKSEDKNLHLQRLEQLYQKARDKLSISNMYRSLSAICQPCLYIKMGLIFKKILKDFQNLTYHHMYNKTGPMATYDLGYFWHVLSSFDINYKVYPLMKKTSNKSFFPGNILLPDPKILLQMLAMSPNLLDEGVKIIWVNTNETLENIDDQMIYYHQFIQSIPKSLENGYYKSTNLPNNNIWNINENGISQPPCQFIKVEQKEEHLVDLKIFEINNILSIYYIQLIQSQQYLQMKKSFNDIGFECYDSLSTHRTHDYLTMAIALSDNSNDLKDLPPLNGQYIPTPDNILIINRQGKAIFTLTPTKSNQPKECMQLRVLRGGKFCPTVSTMPVLHTDIESHPNLCYKRGNLKQYFISFNDDLNKPVENVNLSTFDIAMGMYPSKILDVNIKSKNNSIDIFTENFNGDDDIYILEKTPPNVVYSPHIGFVTLKSICSIEVLVLKNTITLIQNMLARDTDINNYLVKIRDPEKFIEAINTTTV